MLNHMVKSMLSKTLGSILLLISLTACVKPGTSYEPLQIGNGDWLIVGGDDVEPGDPIAKSIVAVQTSKGTSRGTLCTGSILSESLVVTAAHCLPKGTTEGEVIFGLVVKDSFLRRKIIDWKRMEGYAEIERIDDLLPEERTVAEDILLSNSDHEDVAIVRFEGGLPPGYEKATLLKDKKLLKRGTELHVAGYGISAPNAFETRGTLRKAVAPVLIAKSTPREFIIDISREGTCNGDSGGPAFLKIDEQYYLVGVDSRTLTPASAEPCSSSAAFANLLKYSEFITESEQTLKPAPPVKP
jgi:secreted trypsin-like serine protease